MRALADILQDLKQQLGKDRDRQRFSKTALGIYQNKWTNWDNRCVIYQALLSRFPETYKTLEPLIFRGVNVYGWGVNQVAAIYSRPPKRKVGEDDVESFSTERNNLTLDQAAKLTYALREMFIRPMVDEDGLFFDLITPDRVTILPDGLGRMEAVCYQTADSKWLVWTKNHHLQFSDKSLDLKRADELEGNPGNLNPYAPYIPLQLCRAAWPSGEWWTYFQSQGLIDAAISTAVAFTQVERLRQVANSKRMVVKGKPGNDFDRKQQLDPGFPVVVGKDGDFFAVDTEADIVGAIEAILKQAGAVLSMEGIRFDAVRGTTQVANSGYELKLQMTGLEERRDEQRRLWTAYEQGLLEISRKVIEVERRRPEFRNIAPIPEGDLQIEFASTAPESSREEKQAYWAARIEDGTATRVDAIMDMDGLSQEEAEKKLARIQAESKPPAPTNPITLPQPGNPQPEV